MSGCALSHARDATLQHDAHVVSHHGNGQWTKELSCIHAGRLQAVLLSWASWPSPGASDALRLRVLDGATTLK